MPDEPNTTCPSCTTSFACAVESANPCWCMQPEPMTAELINEMTARYGPYCVCPRCLTNLRRITEVGARSNR
jgi:hypothetical protein